MKNVSTFWEKVKNVDEIEWPGFQNPTIVAINTNYHDSSAAILMNGKIVAAAQEERFTRKKHDNSFPKKALQYCLDTAKITIDEVDLIAFTEKPLERLEREVSSLEKFSLLLLC